MKYILTVDVVGLGHVHHEVGGRAEPVAAGKEQLSAGRQVVGAHNVPRVRRQGQGVAVHAYSRGALQPLLANPWWRGPAGPTARAPWPWPASLWRLPAGGLRLEHRAHLHADAGETLLLRLPVPAGHGLQLGDVRQRGRQRLRGRHRHLPRHLPRHALAKGRNCEAALWSLRRVYPRAGAAVGGHTGPVQHADQGLGLRGQ